MFNNPNTNSASIECLYLKCINGGRGLVSIHQAYEQEVVASGLYLLNAGENELLQAVVKLQLFLADKARYSKLQVVG